MINLQRALRGIPESDRHRAERFNREMAKREAGNFYWGFISLGYHERMAIYALYNFARQVDDEADTVGLDNLPARLAVDSSNLYARNLFNFVSLFVDKKTGALALNWDDEIIKGAGVTRGGALVHPSLKG